jgi:pimeloyl-ACP methyl ester carboxylesterase
MAHGWYANRSGGGGNAAGGGADSPIMVEPPRPAGRPVRVPVPGAVRAGGRELAAVAAVALTYRGGLPERVLRAGLCGWSPATAPRPLRAAVPVVLVHGYGGAKSNFLLLRARLEAAGYDVRDFRYSAVRHDVPDLAAALARTVAGICQVTGAPAVHLIGHSLGGVIAALAAVRGGIARRVASVTTLCSPHGGAEVARLGLGWSWGGPGRTAAQLRPGSELLAGLARAVPAGHIRWTAYSSDADVVVSASSARLANPALHADNVLLTGVGHVSVLLSRAVADDVTRRLVRLDGTAADGTSYPPAPPAALAA